MTERATKPPDDPRLPGPGIVLRRVRAADRAALYRAVDASRAELSAWLPWCDDRYDLEAAGRFLRIAERNWDAGREFSFGICSVDDDELLGLCALNQFDEERRRCNLGYWVRTSATRRGIATAAAPRLARWGFETIGLNRIEIVAAAGNFASQRVAEKIGARPEGVLRNRLRVHGRQLDAAVYSFVPEDFGLATR